MCVGAGRRRPATRAARETPRTGRNRPPGAYTAAPPSLTLCAPLQYKGGAFSTALDVAPLDLKKVAELGGGRRSGRAGLAPYK